MVATDSTLFNRIKIRGNPAANAQSMVICGRARFTILTARLIRLEWSSTGEFEDRGTFAFPNRYAAVPPFTCDTHGGQLELRTEALTLHFTDDGQPFNESNLSIEFTVGSRHIIWKPGTPNVGNLRGTTRTLDQCADAINLPEGLLSRDGWSLVDDSATPVWTLDQGWVEGRPDTHLQDWYFFGYEHDYKATLQEYTQFGGPLPLVPRYVLGAWWSRFWAYHADDLKQLVNDFTAHDVPLDVLVIDMDWHTPDAWTGYTWNRELFPDPEGFLAWVHSQGLYATLNLHPAQGVQKHEAVYPQFAANMGHDPALGEAVKFNAADKAFIQNYFELLHHPMEEQGVDFWWVDWQQGESSKIKNLDPLIWLNHLHYQDARRRGKRPMLYSRWGGLGNHRYPIGFSGDSYATWAALRFQPYFTATAANVCYGWWSHDIGGHFGATEPELYARWVQFGAVSPCLRLHSTKDPLAERRPWGFSPEVYEASRAAIQFRYKLLPYLYSAARNAAQKGLSLCYPMYYDYPDHEDAYLARGQYFLGDQLIAAPIVEPLNPQTGLAPVDVWIPPGTWIEYTTHESFTGPHWVRLHGDLNRIPLFAKRGAILPMSPAIMRTSDFDGSKLDLIVFAGADGQLSLYEDDGSTEAYQRGDYELTSVRTTQLDNGTINIVIAGPEGRCETLPARRTITLHVRDINPPARVTVNAAGYRDWYYDQTAREVVIFLLDTDRYAPLNVVVTPDNASDTTASHISEAHRIEPFVHVIDYTTYEDARQQLGTLVIVPPDDSPFDLNIEWTLYKGSTPTTVPVELTQCQGRQIIHSPFADDGSLASFRWTVSISMLWQGRTYQHHYQSEAAYPSLTQWRTAIYNREQQSLSAQQVYSNNGTPNGLNPAPTWHTAAPTPESLQNLRQPFGIVLLEQDRQRILNNEPLEACATTTLLSDSAREAVLCIQCVGEHSCYLNGVELAPTAPIEHAPLQPMFYSWMEPTHTYYAVSLRQGENNLTIFTRPIAEQGWWGIGATLFDPAGKVLTTI